MVKSYRVKLNPTPEQEKRLFECAGVARFVYNWVIDYERLAYQCDMGFIKDGELRKILTQLKKSHPRFQWLANHDCDISKQAVKDAVKSFQKFFKKQSKYPKFKSRKRDRPSFYVDTFKIKFTETTVQIPKLMCEGFSKVGKEANTVNLAEWGRIPTNVKYLNPRIAYDGLHWWISVSVQYPNSNNVPTNNPVGVDLGIKSLATLSDGTAYDNINKSSKIKKLTRQKKHQQRVVARKRRLGQKGKKSKKLIKAEKRLLQIEHRITNIRHDFMHKITSEIISRQPRLIVLEDLKASKMGQNKNLRRMNREASYREFRRQITYKAEWANISVIIADKKFASTKTCSSCGHKRQVMLYERTYTCPSCGLVLDRDLNAAINLFHYGEVIA